MIGKMTTFIAIASLLILLMVIYSEKFGPAQTAFEKIWGTTIHGRVTSILGYFFWLISPLV